MSTSMNVSKTIVGTIVTTDRDNVVKATYPRTYSTNVTTASQTRTWYTRRRVSVTTPQFKLLKGSKPVNNFSFLMEDYPMSSGFYRAYRAETKSLAKTDLTQLLTNHNAINAPALVTGVVSVSEVQALRNRAISKARGKLKDQKINVAQAMAERKQTAKTVGDVALALAKSFSSLKKGNFSGAARALGVTPPKRAARRFNRTYPSDQSSAAANGWLALQYGWKPLLNDVYGAAEFLANNLHARVQNNLKAGASSTQTKDTSDDMLASDARSGFYTYFSHCKHKVQVNVGLTYATTGSELATLKQLGITNPLALGWELLPYSFVVDWFIPIGQFVNNMDATAGLTFVDGYITTYHEVEAFSGSEGSYVDASGTTIERRGLKTFRKIQVDRVKLTSFPSNPAPSFKNPISFDHMANGLALLRNAFKR